MADSADFSAVAQRYTRTAALLHWTIAVLIIVNLAAGFFASSVESAIEPFVMNAHKVIGISVLALSVVRLGWRLTHRAPPLPDHVSTIERWSAGIVHFALYVLMIAMPFSGWLVTSSFPKRHAIDAGIFVIPFLPVTPDKAMAFLAHDAHSFMAWAMIALVLGHVMAALRHQWVLKDGLLARLSAS